ncbi:MAG: hypothetical protein ACXWW0_09010, partial [Bacteroidia bacterium]
MKSVFIIIFSLSIFCLSHICSAQTPSSFTVAFSDKAPGPITKAELLEIADKKNAAVQLIAGKGGCVMISFSFVISDINQNRSFYHEKIKGVKLTKDALEQLKQAEAGNKIILSAF